MERLKINPPQGIEGSTESACDEDIERPFTRERQRMSFREDVWFYWVRVGFLLFASLATLGVVSIYMLHLVIPVEWRWLCDSDMTRLKDLSLTIIVGLLMSVTTTYFFRKKR